MYDRHETRLREALRLQLILLRTQLWRVSFEIEGDIESGIPPSEGKERLKLENTKEVLITKLAALVTEDPKNIRWRLPKHVIKCDACKEEICPTTVQTLHYHCCDCQKYDLCVECVKKVSHIHPLVYQTLPTYAAGGIIQKEKTVSTALAKAFSIYSSRPCVGIRFSSSSNSTYSSSSPSSPSLSSSSSSPGDFTLSLPLTAKSLVSSSDTEGRGGSVEDKKGGYEFYTYKEIYVKALSLASGLSSVLELKQKELVGIYSPNSVEWIVSDLALIFSGVVVVPLHHKLDTQSVASIINNAGLKGIIVADDGDLTKNALEAAKLAANPNFSFLVRIPISSVDHKSFVLESSQLKVRTIEEVMNAGNSQVDPSIPREPHEGDLMTIVYTSGSTGTPKGAPFTNKMWCRIGLELTNLGSDNYSELMVDIIKATLCHRSERETAHNAFANGGRLGLSIDPAQVFDDIRALNPTRISSTPRFWNVLYNEFRRNFEEGKERLRRNETIYSLSKIEDLRKSLLTYFAKYSLGSRIEAISTGGAPTSKVVLDWLVECFGAGRVAEGYGSTEAGTIADGNGNIYGNLQCKVESIPELDYYQDDKPFPRGELLLKSDSLIVNYYNDTQETSKAFTSDGWFRTGDIVELTTPKTIRIIDRKKNIFKLAQGEFVAPERLEGFYMESKFVDQIMITCADIKRFEQNAVSAVVVLNRDYVSKWALENGLEVTKLTTKEGGQLLLKQALLSDLIAIAKQRKLRPFEVPKLIFETFDPWTIENGKMTASNKICRHIVERHYRSIVDSMAEGEQQRVVDSSELNSLDYGDDSLSAVRLAVEIKRKFNVEVSAATLINNQTPISSLATILLEQTGQGGDLATSTLFPLPIELSALTNRSQSRYLEDLIQEDATLAKRLKLIVPLTEEEQDKEKKLEAEGKEYHNILLTGATGFIGSFLLVELLQQSTKSTIHCLVNSKSEEEGFRRLQQALTRYKIDSILDLQEEYSTRVKIVPGDLSKSWFGLETKKWTRLQRKIDSIYHCGALVNHVLPYTSLREINVLGTVEALRFAFERRRKRFNYISSISVLSLSTNYTTEETRISTCSILNSSTSSEVEGYSLSKWVAEQNVFDAIEAGYPVAIFRPGMVSWSIKTGGSNEKDWFNRLFKGVLTLGSMPRIRSKHGLVSVDFVAKAIVTIGQRKSTIGKTFNISHSSIFPFTEGMEVITNIAQNVGEERTQNVRRKIGAMQTISWPLWVETVHNTLRSLPRTSSKFETIASLLLFVNSFPSDTEHSIFKCPNTEQELDLPHIPRVDAKLSDLELWVKNFLFVQIDAEMEAGRDHI